MSCRSQKPPVDAAAVSMQRPRASLLTTIAPKRRPPRIDLRSGSHIAPMSATLEPSQKSIHRRRWYLLVGIAILAALWGGYFGRHHHATANVAAAPAPTPAPAIPASVATAERRDVPIYLTGLGTVQAFNTV